MISTSNITITNIIYNSNTITGISVKNDTEKNVVLDLNNGSTLLTLQPEQMSSVSVNIEIINQYSFISFYTDTLNLTVL
ncbi:hypothetical protein IKS57_03080 [bacterium]|nr:hypothetical protein [bacterium]